MSTRRRVKWGIFVAAAIAFGFVAVTWFLHDHRPGLADGQTYGLDVSHHQG